MLGINQNCQHRVQSRSCRPTPRLKVSCRAQKVPAPTAPRSDVVALGNLCVDVVLPVPELPPADVAYRRDLLSRLSRAPPDQTSWEVGGNCNFMIAAARLGLNVATVGHMGSDVYGKFMEDILKEEKVTLLQRIAPTSAASGSGSSSGDNSLDQTLICFVLVDPNSKHVFCSRYDFGPWPLLDGISTLPQEAMQILTSCRAVFMNGFVFDELPLEVVRSSCNAARAHGAAVFFDPGPRCFTMKEGSRRAALEAVLDLSDVVLMTEEEAAIVTGLDDPEAAARWVVARPGANTEWCVVKLGGAGALIYSKSHGRTFRATGIKVEVKDTVGCGDSFASAIVLGFINGYSIASTLALANAVGAATATGHGAGRNVARADKVMSLLQSAAGEGPLEQQQHVGQAISILQMSLDSA